MPILDPVLNFAKVTVSTGYDSTATTIILNSGDGVKLPNPATDGAFNLTWWNSTDYSDPADDPNVEIIRCTARSVDTLTISRAQEGTSASNKNIANKTYKMILAPTKKIRDDIEPKLTDARPPTANSVGTGNLKTATGVATGTVTNNVTMNDYSFFPSITDDGNVWDIIPQFGADPGNTISRLRIQSGAPAGTWTVRWRYMTASDNPYIWIVYNTTTGLISGVWMSDDPVKTRDLFNPLGELAPMFQERDLVYRVNADGSINLLPLEVIEVVGSPGNWTYLLSDNAQYPESSLSIPGLTSDEGLATRRLPLSELNVLLDATNILPKIRDRGKAKSSRPEVEPYRIAWEAFKNPAKELMMRCKFDVGTKRLIKM